MKFMSSILGPCNPYIYSADTTWSGSYAAGNIFSNGCDEWITSGSTNYWLLPDGVTGQGFIINAACDTVFQNFYLKNTFNEQWNDR